MLIDNRQVVYDQKKLAFYVPTEQNVFLNTTEVWRRSQDRLETPLHTATRQQLRHREDIRTILRPHLQEANLD